MGPLSFAPRLVAVLGPTNTGKTHYAIERMLGHQSGMIGFPLRLLARENYDRLVQLRGAEAVALITGEERIVPSSPRYFVCTVEAMPLDRKVDFLAVDEIQLAADRERGHVFTDRLLRARGLEETMFLGAETIKPLLRRLVPDAAFIARERLSTLTYAGHKKLDRLPRRSAIVVFSLADLYEVAERVRHETGGAAVVFGALSPRTRNAQVALYQAGEVDYLVATDAIGMGLNLDIDHVAFTALGKYDGRGPRPLRPAEVAQIAGRAGRHTRDGTFGPTLDLGPFDDRLVEAVEGHHFEPLDRIFWRNSDLVFASPAALLSSLERRPPSPDLMRMRDADDHRALAALSADADVRRQADSRDVVRLLWDVAQVPDFRNVMTEAHTRLLAQVFRHLRSPAGRLPEDWVAVQVAAIDRTEGDVETLLARIAHIRTWTYVAHRSGWLADPAHWQQRTRAVEDRLSDTLHERLTEQFVERGAAVVSRISPEGAVVEVAEDGEVRVQGSPSAACSASASSRTRACAKPAACAPSPIARCASTWTSACVRSPRSRTPPSLSAPKDTSSGVERPSAGCWRGTGRSLRASSPCRRTCSTPRGASASAGAWPPGWTARCARGCPRSRPKSMRPRSRRLCAGSSSRGARDWGRWRAEKCRPSSRR